MKFRAWDKKLKQWVSVGFHIFGETTLFNIIGQHCFETKGEGGSLLRYNDIEVTQFTGLMDKNGKDIYEGDLLRQPAKDEWEKTNYISYEVFYHDNDMADNHVGFQFNRLHFYGSMCGGTMFVKFLPKYTQKMEIIGNIYENSELLKP